jgi:chromosome segregation ATPase
MKLVVLFFTVAIKCLVFGNSQQEWYKDEVQKNVVPSYIQAYNDLQNGVLNELLTINVASLDDTIVAQLVSRLYCSVRKIYNSLQQSVLASEKLQVDVNTRLISSVAQEGAYEQDIRDKEAEIVQTDITLTSALAQLVLAEQAVIEKQHVVAAADQAVRNAEEDVEKARKCRGKRSWLSKITRPITRPIENIVKDVIIKPVCSIINEGGIDNAKSRRGDAQNQLASARNQEQYYRQVVAEKQALKANLQGQLNQLRSSLVNVQAALQTLQSELATTININAQVDQVFF